MRSRAAAMETTMGAANRRSVIDCMAMPSILIARAYRASTSSVVWTLPGRASRQGTAIGDGPSAFPPTSGPAGRLAGGPLVLAAQVPADELVLAEQPRHLLANGVALGDEQVIHLRVYRQVHILGVRQHDLLDVRTGDDRQQAGEVARLVAREIGADRATDGPQDVGQLEDEVRLRELGTQGEQRRLLSR